MKTELLCNLSRMTHRFSYEHQYGSIIFFLFLNLTVLMLQKAEQPS